MTKAYTEEGGIFGLEGNSNYLTKYFPNGYIKPISEKVTTFTTWQGRRPFQIVFAPNKKTF